MKQWVLISYDVRDDKRLRKVAKHLEGYGVRVQYSGFRCQLTVRQIERLRWELSRMMNSEDSLLVVGLCNHCASQIPRRSSSEAWPDIEAGWVVF